jgi:hypothetical protein
VPYKQIFGQTYPATALKNSPANDVLSLSADGHLSIGRSDDDDASPDAAGMVDIGAQAAVTSVQVLGFGDAQQATTADEQYYVRIETFVHDGSREFWLIHEDRTTGKFKRLKLNAQGKFKTGKPRITVSAGSGLFLADDAGTIRVYRTDTMADLGAFQIAHIDSENQVVALAVSSNERLIAGLSSWKDIVVYDVQQKRIVFVRQIKDSVGWYVAALAQILLISEAEVIATAGLGRDSSGQPSLSVNVFRQIPLMAMTRSVPGSPDSSSR